MEGFEEVESLIWLHCLQLSRFEIRGRTDAFVPSGEDRYLSAKKMHVGSSTI